MKKINTKGGVRPDDPIEVQNTDTIISNNSLETTQKSTLRGKPTRDRVAPTITITSPTTGSTVEGVVTINVTASDNVAVTQVSLSVNGVVIGTDNVAPYSFSWNSSVVPNGTHTVTATARDSSNNTASYSITLVKNVVIVDPPDDPPVDPPVDPPDGTVGYEMLTPIPGTQGGEGSCVAWAVGYGARSIDHYYKNSATSFSNSVNVFSPEFLYNQIKFSSDCNSGTAMQTALEFVKVNGICTWDMMPYTAGDCATLPNSEQTLQAANYKIDSYSKILTTDTEAIKSLVRQNKPVIITVNLDTAFLNAKTGFIWKNTGSGFGIGHSVIIVGYNETLQAWKIMNSFGTAWGTNGFAYMEYTMFPTRTGTYCYAIN